MQIMGIKQKNYSSESLRKQKKKQKKQQKITIIQNRSDQKKNMIQEVQPLLDSSVGSEKYQTTDTPTNRLHIPRFQQLTADPTL